MILMTCCIITSILVFPQEASAASNNTYGEITEGIAASTKTINVLSKKKFYMHPNESINVSVGSKYSKSKVTWSTSTSSILSYSSKSGYKTKITLKKAGTAKGTVKVGSKRYSFTVAVTTIKLLRKNITFSNFKDSYIASHAVLTCSSWGHGEDKPIIKCTNESGSRSKRAVKFAQSGTCAYLYSANFGPEDTVLKVSLDNGCVHSYRIKTDQALSKNAKTAYQTLKKWQEKKSKEMDMTDEEIIDKIMEFSKKKGYRPGDPYMKCQDFAEALFKYLWNPERACVSLDNPNEVDHWFDCRVFTHTLEDGVSYGKAYRSVQSLYESERLFDRYSKDSEIQKTVEVMGRKATYSFNDFNALKVGDLVYCILGRYVDTGEYGHDPDHVLIVMGKGVDEYGDNYILAAESNVFGIGNRGPVYWEKETEKNLNGYYAISFR